MNRERATTAGITEIMDMGPVLAAARLRERLQFDSLDSVDAPAVPEGLDVAPPGTQILDDDSALRPLTVPPQSAPRDAIECNEHVLAVGPRADFLEITDTALWEALGEGF